MPGMELDPQGLEVLSRPQCLRLLRRRTIGRVVFCVDDLPAAFPVNYALLDDDVVFRSAAGAKLSAAFDGDMLAFQVDRVDPVLHSGWSVLVRGEASILRVPDEVARAGRLGLRPTAPGERPFFVRIRSTNVSGRRFASPVESMAESFGAADRAATQVDRTA